MSSDLHKLRPDRDLQCYFQQPTAIAALSETSEQGFTVSGCWRQQFDWAVVEWNRDNVFEHPALRNLPDGDMSGLRLTYEETRTNCIPLDSTSYDSIGWSYLRIWEESGGEEHLHWVRVKDYATPTGSGYVQPTMTFELRGSITPGDTIELAWFDQHFNYRPLAGDTLETAAAALVDIIHTNRDAGFVDASAAGARITLTYTGLPGANGNMAGAYGTVSGAGTEQWSPEWGNFSGGVSPERWRVELDFANLTDRDGEKVTTTNVRKIRWTWAAALRDREFERSEFAVVLSNWQLSGSNIGYLVAGAGSRRIEDDAPEISYSGTWVEERGNYSGGSLRWTASTGDQLACRYEAGAAHRLYLGTRYADGAGAVTVQLDSGTPATYDLKRDHEDVLIRLLIAENAGAGIHTVTVTHAGGAGTTKAYFDFLEVAVAAADMPAFDAMATSTLATDWDTDHSLAIAPERTAWLIAQLGFKGRANHYVGAMWWYELHCPGNRYSSGTIEFGGTPQFGLTTRVTVGRSTLEHANLIGDTAESVAKCFELILNAGSSAVWARASGATLTITARATGEAGNTIAIGVEAAGTLTASVSGTALSGGTNGSWQTDLNAAPRINRGARDWSRSFYRALKGYGIDVAAAFSMELRHGDDSLSAGIGQRYPDGPCWLNTPALQTNFGPESTAFWKQVHADMAGVMTEAGVAPYLQFGEVQWWYFGNGSGMPFYDDYTKSRFQAAYGRPMAVIPSETADPAQYPDECALLPGLIGEFTAAVMAFVRQTYPQTRFEVLYPPDVNDTPLNRIINYPRTEWRPDVLECLKTENFTYTGDRNLDKARESIALPMQLGFSPAKSSHLVGIGEYTTPWGKEQRLALGEGVESVVLFALDQFCLIGYALPLDPGSRRALYMGA